MNYEEIVAMLAAGKSADDIAKEFTDALNKAAAERKAAEEAKVKNEAKSKKMDEISDAIAHALNDYAHVAGIESFEPLRGAEVRQLLDEFLPIMESIKDIKVHVTAPKAIKKNDKPEDVFAWFFNNLGIWLEDSV